MNKVEVNVSPDAYEFYLAFNMGWRKFVGHLIEVDNFRFSAVPINNYIWVSELKSGAKIFDVPIPETVESYEETMMFLEISVASRIIMLIAKIGADKFKEQADFVTQYAYSKYGEKPVGKKVNTDCY